MLRGVKIFAVVLAALILVSLAVGSWLLRTESGTAWLWQRAVNALPGQMSSSSVSGTLGDGLEINAFKLATGSVTISVAKVALKLDPDLFPLRLNADYLALTDVTIRMHDDAAATQESTAAPRDVLSRLQSPVPVLVRKLAINDVRLVAADGAVTDLLTTLTLAGRLGDALGIERLTIVSPWGSLSGEGQVGLQSPFPIAAEVHAQTKLVIPGAGNAPVAIGAKIELSGDPGGVNFDVLDAERELHVSGTVSTAGSAPLLDLTLSAKRLAWPLDSDDAAVAVESLSLHARGMPSDYAVEAEGELVSRWSQRARATASGSGSLQGLQVDALMLAAGDLELTGTAALAWQDDFSVDGQVDIARANPARWIADWPASTFVNGRVKGSYTRDHLQLDELELQQSGGAAVVRGGGVIDFQQNVLDAELTWQSLQWPLAPALAAINSSSGTLVVAGAPSAWQASGDVALSAPELPAGNFRLHGQGGLDRAQVIIDDSDVLGGHVTGTLSYAWRGAQEWTAKLDTQELQLTPLLPSWPGYVSTTFTASGQRTPFRLDLDISRLQGAVRSKPVEATGRVTVAGENVRVSDLAIRSGFSHVRLDGDYTGKDGLNFDADVVSLADFLSGAAGRVQATGNVRSGDDLPLLTFEAHASDLKWANMQAEELTATNDPTPSSPLGLSLSVSGIEIDARTLASASATINGTPDNHQLDVSVNDTESGASLRLDGGVEGWRTPAAMQWSGRLSALEAHYMDALRLMLREPASLSLAQDNASLQRACLDGQSGTSVCAHGNWTHGGSFTAIADIAALPLNLLRVVTGTELEFTQTVSGAVQLSRPARGPVSGIGRVDLSPGEIRNPRDRRLTLRTRAGFASFDLDQGTLLSGELSLPFSSAAEISANFNVVDVSRGQGSPVQGRVLVNIRDIAVGTSILPVVDEVGGALNADIRIGGTVATPEFSGGATLENGLVAYSGLGLRLDDIQLQADIREDNRLELASSFRAGEGRGELTTSANYQKGRQGGLELALSGQNLKIVNVPDLTVIANADLRLGLQDDDVSVNGRIVLPEARLSSARVTATNVSESNDVDFVGELRPPDTELANAKSPLNFSGKVDVELGDRVTIDVNVAEARLRGKSTFTWDGPALPRASGLYEISGKFEAFGQLLEITEGSIRYPDVAADRPDLRIRAEREIFGNSQVRRAGVLVTGTALKPRVEVYTTPATSEDRALTLLATGSDFNYEQGVGAVDVGTYIAPRLYASYGIGLFDRENVISLRYDLGRGFGFKATSGKRASGVDLSYTVEH